MGNRLSGGRFENDWSTEKLEDIYSDISQAVTVPVDIKVETEHRVLDLGRMEEILRGAETIVLQDCGCKVERGNCDAPRDVCLSIDEAAGYEVDSGRYHPRKINLDEALDALRRSHEAGLVHMAYTMKGDDSPKIICSCCPCCCHTLSGLLRFGIAKHVLRSDMISETDRDACTDCGICEERCHFDAREMIDGRMVYNPDQCFGCGLCVTRCPVHAIRLVEKNY